MGQPIGEQTSVFVFFFVMIFISAVIDAIDYDDDNDCFCDSCLFFISVPVKEGHSERSPIKVQTENEFVR